MLGQLNFDGKDKVRVAIERLKNAVELAGGPLYGAFSGGKDSVCIKGVVAEGGVPVDWHYNMPGIDPPELVRFVQSFPDVEVHRPAKSIFKAVETQGMPRRQGRWCCELLKETGGGGRYVVTGIRWAESARRKKRRALEVCRNDKTKVYVNPIIDWSTEEVWEYIKTRGLRYSSLYDEKDEAGQYKFKRLGCVLCPMTTHRITLIEMERWPKLAEGWKRAAYRYYAKGLPSIIERFKTEEIFWQWWISRGEEAKVEDAQCVMFGD